jgi:hypothetical protein
MAIAGPVGGQNCSRDAETIGAAVRHLTGTAVELSQLRRAHPA